MASPPITLLICDDHKLLTDALASLVDTDERLALVCRPVHDAESAVAAAAAGQPDVVLMDVDLGRGPDGIEATRRLLEVSPASKVVIVSSRQEPALLVAAVEAGAVGFLDKNSAVDDVLAVVEEAHAGTMLIDPAVLARTMKVLASERRATQGARARLDALTRREREILALMTEGLRTEGIAERLVISPATVRTHAQNILAKLGAHSQLEAVALAARLGPVADSDR